MIVTTTCSILEVKDGDSRCGNKRYSIPGTNYYLHFIDGQFWRLGDVTSGVYATEHTEKIIGYLANKPPITASLHALGLYCQDFLGVVRSKSAAYGATCTRCNEYNEYVETRPDFVCYGCSH